ncbi:serine/threonine protein kinase [Vibrio cholerae]|nr:hypothetical protein [Vibrio cholerae]EGQ9189862.1 hypothetical protein [Vibrio cholerae]EGR0593611.1 hypothetical protein [Vibrio cholerae]EGR1263061.1 hypothetical protein [Vibrio cholerae]EKF9603850.1 hypothetical protein [Vibrio cholerae]
MNVFTKVNHMIQVKNGNLEKASSSYAFKLGKNELAKIIIGIKNVRDEKKLKQLQDRKSELLSESAKNNVTKILLVKRSIEKNEGKTKKRERRLNQYGFKTVPSSIPETISKSESFDKSQYEFLGKGSRGNVYRDGNNVIKEVNGASKVQIAHELNICNEWYKQGGSSYSEARLLGEHHLQMPFKEGKSPTNEQVKQAISDMHSKGFMIGDAKSNNFVVDEQGSVHPIDFGLVFQRSDIENIASDIAAEIVSDYVKGGYRLIPDEYKAEYSRCIRELDSKCKVLGKINVRYISKAGLLNFDRRA